MTSSATMEALGLQESDCVLGPPLEGQPVIRHITADSREVVPGSLFAALRGTRAHGVDHLATAAARGATIALASPAEVFRAMESLDPLPLPILVDPNPRRRYAELAGMFWPDAPRVRVAVTGTNGKTSTVEFLRQIWCSTGLRGAGIGTLGATGPAGRVPSFLTTPEPAALHKLLQGFGAQGVTHAAMEASSHALAQYRLDGVVPSVGALASFSRDHLDYHGSVAEYAEAKLRLFAELLPASGTAVVNVDGSLGRTALALASARGLAAIPVGVSDCAREGIHIVSIGHAAACGLAVEFAYRGEPHSAVLPIAGDFQVRNALLAAACAIGSGLAADAAFAALKRLQPVRGRMELAAVLPTGARAFVDYAHTPDALDTVLRSARRAASPAGRVHVVFGAGGDRDAGKRKKMGEIAARRADRVVITDDNPRSEDPGRIREEVRAGAPGAAVVGDRREAIRFAIRALRAGDVLVVAGKGHEAYQETADGTIPFDDADTIRKFICERNGDG